MTAQVEFPYGLTVNSGRYRLDSLLRGTTREGLWSATRLGSEPATVLVTLRRLPLSRELEALLRFSAPGIPAPLYVGIPDKFGEFRDANRRQYLCVVDEQPAGSDLVASGLLTVEETARVGVSLCDAITGWAATRDGTISRGLRPETIFVAGSSGQRTFSGVTPRPFILLGDDGMFAAYRHLNFDPPADSIFVLSISDALFTVALILWHAFTGLHPYGSKSNDIERNIWNDRRAPFAGPQVLGGVLESALVADPGDRSSVEAFRAQLLNIASQEQDQAG